MKRIDKKKLSKSASEAASVLQQLSAEPALSFMEESGNAIIETYTKGGKLLIAGNGGSLCDADHFAEELTGYFRKERKALAAMSLSHPGHMSCVANDRGFEYVFSRAVEALGKKEDLLILLSTSGSSLNLLRALEQARRIGMKVISFLGKNGGVLKGRSDLEWVVSGTLYSDRIQEAHMAAIHLIIEAIEDVLESI